MVFELQCGRVLSEGVEVVVGFAFGGSVIFGFAITEKY